MQKLQNFGAFFFLNESYLFFFFCFFSAFALWHVSIRLHESPLQFYKQCGNWLNNFNGLR